MRKNILNTNDKDLLADLYRLKDELKILGKELRSDRSADPQAERNIRLLTKELFTLTEASGFLRRAGEIPSKEAHYNRNRLMVTSSLPQSPKTAEILHWDSGVGAACHQFTSPDRSNIKYVSPDGHSEVIYDRSGHIVTAPEDYGTYNFADSRQDPVGHFYQDVLPWLLWGNEPADSTDMRLRLKALVVYGGAEAALSHIGSSEASRT